MDDFPEVGEVLIPKSGLWYLLVERRYPRYVWMRYIYPGDSGKAPSAISLVTLDQLQDMVERHGLKRLSPEEAAVFRVLQS